MANGERLSHKWFGTHVGGGLVSPHPSTPLRMMVIGAGGDKPHLYATLSTFGTARQATWSALDGLGTSATHENIPQVKRRGRLYRRDAEPATTSLVRKIQIRETRLKNTVFLVEIASSLSYILSRSFTARYPEKSRQDETGSGAESVRGLFFR